jgi:hypothetical protein
VPSIPPSAAIVSALSIAPDVITLYVESFSKTYKIPPAGAEKPHLVPATSFEDFCGLGPDEHPNITNANTNAMLNIPAKTPFLAIFFSSTLTTKFLLCV